MNPSTPTGRSSGRPVPKAAPTSSGASAIPVVRDPRGRIAVDAATRSRSHPAVWALGDCAAIPGPDGRPYPALAQHALREARHLARNLAAVIDGRAPSPFGFRSLGTMASLGHTRAVASVFGVRFSGFPAWWLRRTYYLFQMPTGIAGCGSSSTGPSASSSGRTPRASTCAWNANRPRRRDVLFAPGVRHPAEIAALVDSVRPKPLNLRSLRRWSTYGCHPLRRLYGRM